MKRLAFIAVFILLLTPLTFKENPFIEENQPNSNQAHIQIIPQAPQPNFNSNIPLSEELQGYVHTTADAYGIDPLEVYAVMQKESGYDPLARSETGDFGLMQVNRIHLKELKEVLGVTDLLDSYQNVHAGIFILSQLKDLPLNERLIAYNMGRSGMKKVVSRGMTTTSYSRAVMENKKELERGLNHENE